jgi:DNA-binding MarR family transcriptional regulator/predicted RNA-binding protein
VSQVDLDQSVGYALKRAQHALHSTMDGELRDYGLSVSQYAALQILASRPRISNADLARDAFVSRQAMHQLLTGLQATGLVTAAGQGRSQRYALTPEGHTRLRTASSTVAAIEQRMIATLSRAKREQLHRQLNICTTALDSRNQQTYWVNTISHDHVQPSVEDGFTQAGHGKASGLKRLKANDWLVYYSPKTSLRDGKPLQAFTAIGRIADEELYQVEQAPGFTPWRRNIQFIKAIEAPIRPLIDQLSFIKDKRRWGNIFRVGIFKIPHEDFTVISQAMTLKNPNSPRPAKPSAGDRRRLHSGQPTR